MFTDVYVELNILNKIKKKKMTRYEYKCIACI